jgi:hypothetical protein
MDRSGFLSGVIAMSQVVAALFFLKFWRRTGDHLFAIFSAAFLLMALNQGLFAAADLSDAEDGWIYVIRLAAFLVIIGGILWTNLRNRPH